MFLDEKLLQIANKCDLTEQSINDCCIEMVNAAYESVTETINMNESTDQVILAQFKRVNNVWMAVCDKLEAQGKWFLNREGFRNYIHMMHEGGKFLLK